MLHAPLSLQVTLYLAGAGDPPEVPLPQLWDGTHLAPAAAKERSLDIICFLMMSVYTSVRPAEPRRHGTVPLLSDQHLLR